MNSETALFELTVMDAESSSYEFEDFYVWGTKQNIPPEVLTRLREVWDFVKEVGGQVVSVGKIIIQTIWDFLKKNPKLAAGLVVGLAVGFLVSTVPVLGPVLAGVAALYSVGVGIALDEGASLDSASDGMVVLKALVQKAMALLAEVINGIGEYWEKEELKA